MEKTKLKKAYLICENKSFVPVEDVVDIHSHENKEILDKITQAVIDNMHEHENKAYLDKIEEHMKEKAPTSHASTGTGYGVGTTENYGHVKIINALTKSAYANGEVLSAHQGKLLKDMVDRINKSMPVQIRTGTIAMRIGTGNNSAKLFSLSQVLSLFGLSSAPVYKFAAFATNGDGNTSGAHYEGATWKNNELHITWEGVTGTPTDMRFNWVIIYNPNAR